MQISGISPPAGPIGARPTDQLSEDAADEPGSLSSFCVSQTLGIIFMDSEGDPAPPR